MLNKLKLWFEKLVVQQLAKTIVNDSLRYLYINPDQVLLIVTTSQSLMNAFNELNNYEEFRERLQNKGLYVLYDEFPNKTTVIIKSE